MPEKLPVCLRVTEVIGCKLMLWLRHNTPNILALPSHPITSAGTELHKTIELYLNNELQTPYMTSFKHKQNLQKFENFLLFIQDKPLKDVVTEKRFYRTYTGSNNIEYTISGQIDMSITHKNNYITIYDFKSGRLYRKENLLQLAGYKYLYNEHVQKCTLVYLGNMYPMEISFNPNIKLFMKELKIATEVLKLEKAIDINPNYIQTGICAFCEYIHICRKIIPQIL